MTILVTGASGNVGSEILPLLRSRGLPLRAAVREPATDSYSDAVEFDFLRPSTWEAAFSGVTSMFLVRPPALSNVSRDIVPALDAAQSAGVRHVVFLSLHGADTNRIVPHARIESWLRASDMTWTFLRPSFFMQNLSTTLAPSIRDQSEILVPAGGGRTAFVDVVDVARMATEVFGDLGRHTNRAWTPTGRSANTYDEVARILSDELGRSIRYLHPGLFRYAAHARRDLRMPWEMVVVTAVIYSAARLGRAGGLTDDVYEVTGELPIPLRDFVHRERRTWEQSRISR